jgi:hypothetical protein
MILNDLINYLEVTEKAVKISEINIQSGRILSH